MVNIFFIWMVLLILLLFGIFCDKLMKLHLIRVECGVFLMPLIGLIGIINVIEICNLFMTIQTITILLFVTLFFIGVWLRKRILATFKEIWKNKMLLFLMFMASILFAYPVVRQNELISFQIDNNDIMYYLASMDWLTEHTSTQEVVYSDTAPFYWCAEYMLERTRIGFDGFGAFIMCLFGLQAHQVFSDMGILFILLSIPSVVYLLGTVLQVGEKKKFLYTIVVLLGAGWGELLIYQYVPQIAGIVCLITFVGVTIEYFIKEQENSGILMSWILAGTVAVYAEYAAYLFVIYLGLWGLLAYRRKNWKCIKDSIWYGVIGLFLNPVGIYRGIRLNLFVLQNTQGGMENIDPYAGKMMEYYQVFGKMFGCLVSSQEKGMISALTTIVLIEGIGIVLLCFIFYLVWIKDKYKLALMGIAAFFTGYELYFRQIKYAYGEYKHILTISSFAILLFLYVLDKLQTINKYKKWIDVMEWSTVLILSICGCFCIESTIGRKDLYLYNHELEELSEAVHFLPQEEIIGISGLPATIHGEVYALRDAKATILANNISYFPFSLSPSTRYRVYEGNHILEDNEKSIWSNDRFTIVENTGLQSCFYSGFHGVDDVTTKDRWTCDKESIIVVSNYADKDKKVSLCFGTDAETEKQIIILYKGTMIAQAKSGEQVVTEPIILEEQDAEIHIYVDDLDIIDGRTVGIKLKNYMLLDYSGER